MFTAEQGSGFRTWIWFPDTLYLHKLYPFSADWIVRWKQMNSNAFSFIRIAAICSHTTPNHDYYGKKQHFDVHLE